MAVLEHVLNRKSVFSSCLRDALRMSKSQAMPMMMLPNTTSALLSETSCYCCNLLSCLTMYHPDVVMPGTNHTQLPELHRNILDPHSSRLALLDASPIDFRSSFFAYVNPTFANNRS